MFIGHYAVAFGAKKSSPGVSLGTFFLAVQFLDLLWPILLLAGVEHVRIDPGNTPFTPLDFYDYPISHGLISALAYSTLFGLVYYFVRRDRKGGSVLALAVFSHWALDFVTHRPDLPISPWSGERVGLGLWNSVAGTIVVEGALFVAGLVLYLRSTVRLDRTGQFALWFLVGFITLSYIATLLTPPPPNETALAIGGLLFWLIVPWGYWIDRHRESRPMTTGS
jgi:hypothetical protein